MPKAKSNKKNKKSKVSQDDEVCVAAAAAADVEKWDQVRVIEPTEEIECRLDGCNKFAMECWASNFAPDDLWHMCSTCVEAEFGPPPDASMTEANKDDAPLQSIITEETNTTLKTLVETPSTEPTNHVSDSSSEDEDKQTSASDESIKATDSSSSVIAPESQVTPSMQDDAVHSRDSQVIPPTQDETAESKDAVKEPQQDANVVPTEDTVSTSVSNEVTSPSLHTDSSDVDMEGAEEEEEAWDLTKVMSQADLSKEDAVQCKMCDLTAAVVYASTLTKEEWYNCIDCQVADYGGWPETAEEIPITFMSIEHKALMAKKCSKLQEPGFPNLPETPGGAIPKPSVAAQSTALDPEDEAEEGWDLKKVMSHDDLAKDGTIKCSTETCFLAAATIYMSTLSQEKWYTCLDCQENDYGGWPDKLSEIPINSMSLEHKNILTEKCSRQSRPKFPIFPETPTKTPRTTNTLTPPPNGSKQVTPTPGAKKSQPSSQAMAIHRKWQAAAEAVGGKEARIVVDKKAAKKLIVDYLYDAFRPMNITQVHTGLKAVVPSPVLKQCLDDMALAMDDDRMLFADSDDDEPKPIKKKTKNSSDEFAGVLAFKAGRNVNTSLYYVDHTKQKNNGNGLESDAREQLYTNKMLADAEQSKLKLEIKTMDADTKRLNSEPTNEEATAKLETEEAVMKDLREQLDDARKLKGNEKHKQKTKRGIEGMATQWRKRRRICMDFLVNMEECTDGTISMKKCLSGDGQIDVESDEKALKDSKTFAETKRSRKHRKPSRKQISKKVETSSSSSIAADENLIGVELDSQGTVRRIYLDED